MNEIGGYFSLELKSQGQFVHDDGVLLNSGRNSLEYVIKSLDDVKFMKVPYYTCDVVIEQIEKLHISYDLYHINEKLEIECDIALNRGEYLLYTNYYGIKDSYVKLLANKYGQQLIIDNSQAWFAMPINGISTVYSPRKYVGIPDGGIAYCPKSMDVNLFEQDVSFDRCSHLLKRIDLGATEAYADFKENGLKLRNQPIRRMSKLTMALLACIDFETIKRKRKENFKLLHEALKYSNEFEMPEMSSFECPMVYPYLSKDTILRQRLIDNKIFVATYWPNVKKWSEDGMLEKDLTESLLPVPCDQRLELGDINSILALMNRNDDYHRV